MIMKAVTVLEAPRFCPHCGKRLTEYLTSAPMKCVHCRLPLGVIAWTPIEEWAGVRDAVEKLQKLANERAVERGES
jgi:ribosomal protein L37AE/L43A